ncbi:hypothetical protein U9M48_006249 [Paspalum notatum var. saurae]|uniref:Uncharacterized protein n=1 Tax=Paspalum notatum var. saurae TaxID=547442 RepID=A0AAQ3PZE5_PASNO
MASGARLGPAAGGGARCGQRRASVAPRDVGLQGRGHEATVTEENFGTEHRYGHNLHYYYQHWLHCERKQPFFYWCSSSETFESYISKLAEENKLKAKERRLIPRTTGQGGSCCSNASGIFSQKERATYEVMVEDGKMMYKLMSQKRVDTFEGPRDAKWIFVLSTTRILYIGVGSPTTPA